MFTIKNKEQLCTAYVLLRYYQKAAPAVGKDDLCDENIKEMKRAIRTYTHRSSDPCRTIEDDGDRVIFLLPLPEQIATKESARGYFMSQLYIEARPSMYDCTGQAFTSWFKIIERGGRFWAYHCVCFDV